MAWLEQNDNMLWTLRVSDRFGDAGLTGILSVRRDGENLHLVDFVLSCRVFGRQIEDLMLWWALEYARSRGCKSVIAQYLETAKNKPCLEFLNRSGMDRTGDGTIYHWDISRDLSPPEHIQIEKVSSDEND